jgi:hypothetical protein
VPSEGLNFSITGSRISFPLHKCAENVHLKSAVSEINTVPASCKDFKAFAGCEPMLVGK